MSKLFLDPEANSYWLFVDGYSKNNHSKSSIRPLTNNKSLITCVGIERQSDSELNSI